MDPISAEVKRKLQEVSSSVSSIIDPHKVGNDDIRKLLEVFRDLIKHADADTQRLSSINNILEAARLAIAFLEEHPGGPPGVH